jgi:hypothetical protein
MAPIAVQDILPPVDPHAAANARYLVERERSQRASGERRRLNAPKAERHAELARTLGILEQCACGRRPNVAGYSPNGKYCRTCGDAGPTAS